MPDDELLELAEAQRLSKPRVLAAQVKRMLADDRAKSLVDDFAFQWLDLAKLDTIVPDRGQFPQASGLLDPRDLMKEELDLFVDSVLRSDQSVMELLDRGLHVLERAPRDALRHRDRQRARASAR